MDQSTGSIQSNDENTSIAAGKKRQQMQSPFSAATPKSRIGKEPKRLFNASPLTLANKADSNLEETSIETPTPMADITDQSFLSNTSVVDPNLEQTAILEQTVVLETSSKDLSLVEEGDETDADVTLADTFEEKVSIENEGPATPTPGSPKPLPDDVPTPTAPTVLASHIQMTTGSVSDITISSPMNTPKHVVDQSLHEFLMLEQEVEFAVSNDDLREHIANLQRQIEEINAARVFEEKALMQQTEAVMKKSKAERATAQETIRQLEEKIVELETTGKREEDSEKKQLELQLTELTALIEKLTEKAGKVEDLQQGLMANEQKLQQLQEENNRFVSIVTEIRAENEKLQAQIAEGSEIAAKVSESEARVSELEQDREELRQMMIQEMASLESQLDETREQLKKAQEQSLDKPVEDQSGKVAEMEEQLSTFNSKVEQLEQEIAKKAADFEALRDQHAKELQELREAHLSAMAEAGNKFLVDSETDKLEIANAQAKTEELTLQLDSLRTESVVSVENIQKKHDEDIQKLIISAQENTSELENARHKIEELTSELAATEQKLASLRDETTANSEQIQKKYEQQVQELQEKLSEKMSNNSEVDGLNFEIASLQQLLENAKIDAATKEESYISQISEMAAKLDNVPVLEKQIGELNEKIGTLSTDHNEHILKRETELYEKYLQQSKVLEEEINELKSSHAAQLATHTAQQADELTALRKQHEKEMSEIRDEQQNIEKDVLKLAEQKYDEEVSELRSQLSAAQSIIDNHNEEINEMKSSLAAQLASQNDQQAAELIALQKQHEEEIEKLRGYQQNIEMEKVVVAEKKHEEEVSELRNQLSVAQSKIDEMSQLAVSSTELVETIENKMKEAVQQLQEQLTKSEEANADLEACHVKIDELTSELATVQLTLNVLENEKMMATEEIRKKNEESVLQMNSVVEELQAKLSAEEAAAEEKTRVLGETIQQQTAVIESLRSELAAAIERSDLAHNETTAQMDAKISELTGEISSLQSEIALVRGKSEADLAEAQEAATVIRQQLEEALLKIKVDEQSHSETLVSTLAEKEAALQTVEELRSQLAIIEKEVSDLRSDEQDLDVLNARIVELETSTSSLQQQLLHVEAAHKQTAAQLESALEEVNTSRDVVAKYEKEIASLTSNVPDQTTQEELSSARLIIAELTEKLDAAEQILGNKETSIIALESRIETISNQFEERLNEASHWKTQAQSVEVLTNTIQSMQSQLKEMSERMVAERATADHDLTIVKEEVVEQGAELNAARLRILELEEDLHRSRSEVERLEKVCDDFDEDERKLKEQIRELRAEVKQLKGVKSPPKAMGLIQMARMGIKPLSPENSHVEQPKEQEDPFEDASDSFATGQPPQRTMTQNTTVVQSESPNATAIHPDDSRAPTTPSSKKANRSNCQQQ